MVGWQVHPEMNWLDRTCLPVEPISHNPIAVGERNKFTPVPAFALDGSDFGFSFNFDNAPINNPKLRTSFSGTNTYANSVNVFDD